MAIVFRLPGAAAWLLLKINNKNKCSAMYLSSEPKLIKEPLMIAATSSQTCTKPNVSSCIIFHANLLCGFPVQHKKGGGESKSHSLCKNYLSTVYELWFINFCLQKISFHFQICLSNYFWFQDLILKCLSNDKCFPNKTFQKKRILKQSVENMFRGLLNSKKYKTGKVNF